MMLVIKYNSQSRIFDIPAASSKWQLKRGKQLGVDLEQRGTPLFLANTEEIVGGASCEVE